MQYLDIFSEATTDFSHDFGKEQYTFYTVKLTRFAEKNITIGGNTKISFMNQRVKRFPTTKIFRSQTFFEEFLASRLHESF